MSADTRHDEDNTTDNTATAKVVGVEEDRVSCKRATSRVDRPVSVVSTVPRGKKKAMGGRLVTCAIYHLEFKSTSQALAVGQIVLLILGRTPERRFRLLQSPR